MMDTVKETLRSQLPEKIEIADKSLNDMELPGENMECSSKKNSKTRAVN